MVNILGKRFGRHYSDSVTCLDGGDIRQDITIRMIEFYHIDIRRWEESRSRIFSLSYFFFDLLIIAIIHGEINISDMVTIGIRFPDIEMRVGGLWDVISRRDDDRVIKRKIFLTWIIG